MIQKRRTLGLGLLAVLAFAAVTASAAQAGEFRAEKYPASVSGKQLGETTIKMETGTFKCSVSTFTGTLAAEGSAELETERLYEGCSVGGESTDVKFNGCHYVYHLGKTINGSPDEIAGSMEVKCPANQKIEFTITNGVPDCTVTVPPQKELGPVTYTNKTLAEPMDIEVDTEITNFHYTLEGKGCSKEGTFNNGIYTSHETIVGETAFGSVTVT